MGARAKEYTSPHRGWRHRFYIHQLPGLDELPRGVRPARFPAGILVAIKAFACELPSRRGLPLAC